MAVSKVFGRNSVESANRELERLAALERLDVLDTPREQGFERIVRLIQSIFTVDIGIVSFIDAHRQWYKSCSGLSADEVPREGTFCQFVVDTEEPMILPDASKDARFAQHPAVIGDAHIRFYAGVPLKTAEGHVVGTLCAIDKRPRSFGQRDLIVLEELAAVVMDRVTLMQTASSDGLTGALTRRAFRTEAERLISLAVRHQHEVACLMLDIDHFKHVNDTHGHAAGDQVLKAVASACKTALRATDLIGREGGEEFAILLPQISPTEALAVAEKVRSALEELEVEIASGTIGVTASIGVSSLSLVGREIETLMAQADSAMYRAKQAGRNQCMEWGGLRDQGKIGTRRRVLKAGSIIFNDNHSVISCTIKTLGSDGARLAVSSTTGIPAEFTLVVSGDNFRTKCRIVAEDRQNLEVLFA